MSELENLSEIETIWADLRDLLEWQQGFALYLVFAEDARRADVLLDSLSAWCTAHALAIQAVRPLHSATALNEILSALPGNPVAPNTPLWLDLGAWSSDSAWQGVRREVLAALNQRRSWLEQACQRPLFLHLPESIAAEVVTWAPDLWSIKRYLAVLPSSQTMRERESQLDAEMQAALAREDAHISTPARGADMTQDNTPALAKSLSESLAELLTQLAARHAIPAPPADKHQAVRDFALALAQQAQQNQQSTASETTPEQTASTLTALQDSLSVLRNLRQLHHANGDTPQTLADIATGLQQLANAQLATAEFDEARQNLYAAIGLRQRIASLSGETSENTLIPLMHSLAALEQAAGKAKRALTWREKALVLQRKLAQAQAESSATLPGLLNSLRELAQAQLAVGQIILAHEHEQEIREIEALLEAETAVRQLEAHEPEAGKQEERAAYLAELAACLDYWANLLAEYGKRAWAFKVQAQAVTICEELAEQNFAVHGPDLAGTLNNWSNRLAEMGQREKALAAILRAVTIYEAPANQEPERYKLNLAASLSNYAILLGEAGQREPALAAILRAVEIHEELASQDFVAYGPDLAQSLNNCSVQLAKAGQRQQALVAIQRAVKIGEDLARQNFSAYGLDLAISLNNWAHDLADADQHDQALAAMQRAVAIDEDLAKQNFAAYGPRLAASLNNYSVYLASAGQAEQALTAISRSVAIREDLAKQNFTAYGQKLAFSLNNYSIRLTDSGQAEQALAAIKRAIAIFEDLAQQTPAAYAPALASSLYVISHLLPAPEAIVHLQRALSLIQTYALPGTLNEERQQAIEQDLQTLLAELPPPSQ